MEAVRDLGKSMAEYWWAFVIRGLFGLLFGIGTMLWPDFTLQILLIFFGVYCFVDGITTIVMAFSEKRWWYILEGLVSIAAGVIVFAWPGITAVTVIWIIGFWAIVRGVWQIMAAIQLRKEIDNEWMLILGGIVSILFGVLVVTRPGAGILAVTWMIGLYALVFGIFLMILGFRLRKARPGI